MYRLRELEESELLGMLTEYTAHYTRMLNENDRSRVFYECKRMIEKITAEITSRKENEPPARDRSDPYPGEGLTSNPDQF